MKSFNKKKLKKHTFKNKRSIIKNRMFVKDIKEFDRIIKGNGSKVTCVFAKDRNGKQIGVYAIRYNKDFICQDVLCEGRLYSIDRNIGYEDYFGIMPVVNGYFIEIDAYPVFKDWVEFPITDVEFISNKDEQTICERLIEKICIA